MTLQLWTNSEQTITYAKEFSQRNHHVQCESTTVGDYDILAQKALTAVAAGTPPDVSVLGQRQDLVHKTRVTPSKRPNVTTDFGTGAAAMLDAVAAQVRQLQAR